MTNRYGQGIGGIEELRSLSTLQDALQHKPHLLFVGITIACNGLFYLFWRVLRYGKAGLHGSSNGYSLCTTQLKHTLYVLAKKGRLDRTDRWLVLFNKFKYAYMDQL